MLSEFKGDPCISPDPPGPVRDQPELSSNLALLKGYWTLMVTVQIPDLSMNSTNSGPLGFLEGAKTLEWFSFVSFQ